MSTRLSASTGDEEEQIRCFRPVGITQNVKGRQIPVTVRARRRFPLATRTNVARDEFHVIAIGRHADGHAESSVTSGLLFLLDNERSFNNRHSHYLLRGFRKWESSCEDRRSSCNQSNVAIVLLVPRRGMPGDGREREEE